MSLESNGEKGKISRYKPQKSKASSFVFQDGDAEILVHLSRYRYLTTEMLSVLTERSQRTLWRRLRMLFDAGFIGRIPFKSGKGGWPTTVIHVLTPKGAGRAGELTAKKVISTPLKNENREYQLAHHLLVSHFHVVLEAACRNHPDIELLGWKEGATIHKSVVDNKNKESSRYPVAPDGFFGIRDKSRPEGQQRLYFFFEADRSTMSHATFQRKLTGYVKLWKLEQSEKLYGMKTFRVLTITEKAVDWQAKRGQDRLGGLLQVVKALDPSGTYRRLFLYATRDQLPLANPTTIFENIWQAAEEPSGDGHRSIINE